VTGTTPAFTRQNLVYGYDANGNVTSVQDTVAGESLTYTYDVLDRLTGASGAYSESYTYNATTGNLASKGGQTLSYGAPNHPHAATAMGSNLYTYDANGNMLTRKVAGVTYTLSYDAEGRLTGITGTGLSASYTYNGDGERVKAAITTGGVTKTTAYVGDYFEVSLGTPATTQPPVTQNCVTSHCAFLPFVTTPMAAITNGQALTSYYYLGGQRIALRIQSRQLGVTGGTYYPLSDHLGGTTVTLDGSANRYAELRYKAWGQTRYTYGTTPTQRRYTGQLEAEAGLYFYNARWFDPALGRFSQPDPEVPERQGVQAFNRYAYVNNSPINYSDPSGHKICWEDGYCQSKGYSIDDHLSYYGVSHTGNSSGWTDRRKLDILLGVQAVASTLSNVIGMGLFGAANTFRSVFGQLSIEWCNNCVSDGYGWANGDHKIRFDGIYKDPTKAMRLVVHELGHIFDRAVCAANDPSGSCTNIFGNGTARNGLSGRTMLCSDSQHCLGRNGHTRRGVEREEYWGFAGGWADWQFGANDDVGELWADMFLGWAFGTWEASLRGANRQKYMNNIMPVYANLFRRP
jgi:RHS repeat-associated protein